METLATSSEGFSSAFVAPTCDHKVIFSDVYLRTNRTNHTKIMRCFPHCCPDHRKRSYCGSVVHLKLWSDRAAASNHRAHVALEELVVFARFRPMEETPLALGDRVGVDEIAASLQSQDPSKGQWVESKLDHYDAIANSWLFEVNSSGRWYYPWSGAATIAMRATEHVFEALAFRRLGAHSLEVVATSVSPKFRLQSYRRGINAAVDTTTKAAAATTIKTSPRKNRKLHKLLKSPTSLSLSHKVQQTLSSAFPSPPAVHKPYPSIQESRKLHTSAPLHLLSPIFPASVQPVKKLVRHLEPDVAIARSQLDHPTLYGRPHGFQSVALRKEPPVGDTLSKLLLWLQELPVSSVGSRWMLSWERMMEKACVDHVLAARERSSGVARGGLVPILSALGVEAEPSMSMAPSTPMVAPLEAIDAAVRVVLHEWLDVDSVRASHASVMRSLRGTSNFDRDQLAADHAVWLREVETRAKRFVHSHTRVAWSHLVTKAAQLGGHDHHQCLNVGDEFSHRAFVAQSRQQFIQETEAISNLSRGIKRRRSSEPKPLGLSAASSRRLVTSRVWTSTMNDVSIVMDDMTQNPLSLLTVLQFWRQLSCVQLDYTALRDRVMLLSIASVFNAGMSAGDASCMRLVLDGKHRWFTCLPSGDATCGTTLMGLVVGDYVGCRTSVGTIHVTTFAWPSAVTEPTAYAWHWTIDATSLTTAATTISLVVECAPVQPQNRTQAFETMSIAEKLRAIGRWRHLCQAQLAYTAH